MLEPFLEILVLDGILKLNNKYYKKLRETLMKILRRTIVHNMNGRYIFNCRYYRKDRSLYNMFIKLKNIDSFRMFYKAYDTIEHIKEYENFYGFQYLIYKRKR
jgi:hypothetical protein